MAGSRKWMREKTMQRIEDIVASSNGLSLTEINDELGMSIGTVTENVRVMLKQGRLTKGVKRNISEKTGKFTGALGPAYYVD